MKRPMDDLRLLVTATVLTVTTAIVFLHQWNLAQSSEGPTERIHVLAMSIMAACTFAGLLMVVAMLTMRGIEAMDERVMDRRLAIRASYALGPVRTLTTRDAVH
jgi:hypothetical protein